MRRMGRKPEGEGPRPQGGQGEGRPPTDRRPVDRRPPRRFERPAGEAGEKPEGGEFSVEKWVGIPIRHFLKQPYVTRGTQPLLHRLWLLPWGWTSFHYGVGQQLLEAFLKMIRVSSFAQTSMFTCVSSVVKSTQNFKFKSNIFLLM